MLTTTVVAPAATTTEPAMEVPQTAGLAELVQLLAVEMVEAEIAWGPLPGVGAVQVSTASIVAVVAGTAQ